MITAQGMWTETEQVLAQQALAIARQRETDTILAVVREQAAAVIGLEDLWQISDFLNARRFDLDGKYMFDCETLIFAFARLVKEGWLSPEELAGLDRDKVARIRSLSRM
ncbi:MAG: hypothetical protein HC918_10140 [Oscillatoriales cyanobacterium SM2_1_8]|nr:hypothetical protein [Oscillatoriales cyanobacterium SM2_1_8]